MAQESCYRKPVTPRQVAMIFAQFCFMLFNGLRSRFKDYALTQLYIYVHIRCDTWCKYIAWVFVATMTILSCPQ